MSVVMRVIIAADEARVVSALWCVVAVMAALWCWSSMVQLYVCDARGCGADEVLDSGDNGVL